MTDYKSGGYHAVDGWLNADLIAGDIYLDATKRLPLPDGCFGFIFAAQFIEHVSLRDGRRFSEECYRILRPGGVIRLSSPDLDRLVDVYGDGNPRVRLEEAMARHESRHSHSLWTGCHS